LQGEGVPVDSVLEEGRLDEETADQEKISHSLDELAPEADFDEAPEGFSEEDESAEEFFAQPVVVKKVVEEKPRAKFETENLGDDEDLTEEIREVKTTEKAEFVPEEEAEEIHEEISDENLDEEIGDENLDEENSAEELSDENLDEENSADEISDENLDDEDSAEEIGDENLDGEDSAEEISDENLDDENSAEEISDENLDDKNSAEEIGDENLDGEDSAEEFSDENLDGEDSAEEFSDENLDGENSADEIPTVEDVLEKSEGNSAAKLFEKLKSLSSFLPDEKKSDFMESRNRLRLEYIISRLHGKRGLLKTAESMRKGEMVGNESESGFFLLLKVLNIMDVLSSGLQDENLASAAAKEIEKLKSKLV
jgi:hypothetical protein